MNREEILKKAIQKAIDGGWAIFDEDFNYGGMLYPNEETGEGDYVIMNDDDINPGVGGRGFDSIYDIIFDHDFAKALWGVTPKRVIPLPRVRPSYQDKVTGYVFAWQYHLQQMVIAEDPIKYLSENT